MAIVIQDADGRDAREIEVRMRAKIERRQYSFPVHCYAVRQAMEAWLLADEKAISIVTARRSNRRVVKSHRAPEGLRNPKEVLRELLEDNKVTYTAVVGAEIAREIDVQVVSDKCPRFRVSAELVDC